MKTFLEATLLRYNALRADNRTVRACIWMTGGHYFDSVTIIRFDEDAIDVEWLGSTLYIDMDNINAMNVKPR